MIASVFAVLVVAASALALAGGLAAGLLEDRGRCARGGGHVEAKNCRDELSADLPSVTVTTVTCDRVCVGAKAEDERPIDGRDTPTGSTAGGRCGSIER